MDACGFSERIQDADLILTGEGKIDDQTAFGKILAGIASRANIQKIPVIAFAGRVENTDTLSKLGITRFFPICQESLSVKQCMADAKILLQSSVDKAMRTCEIY